MVIKLFCVFTTVVFQCLTTSVQAESNIPSHLTECYQNEELYARANRLPMSMPTLIELIWTIEQYPGFQMDIQSLALSLLQMFRMDGIEEDTSITPIEGVIPFKQTGLQWDKYAILSRTLIPRSSHQFPNGSLTPVQKCSLHFMLSNTFDKKERGDESTTCSVITGRYKREVDPEAELMPNPQDVPESSSETVAETSAVDSSAILNTIQPAETNITNSPKIVQPQEPESPPQVQEKKEDPLIISAEVDIIDPKLRAPPKDGNEMKGDMQMNMDGDHEYNPQKIQLKSIEPESSCPVESGVVYTPWGSVMAGTLLAGIATGLAPQNVSLLSLLVDRKNISEITISNQWAATLAGDLAEVMVKQIPRNSDKSGQIGVPGAWNNTQLPKWYFVGRNEKNEMTDAEIRGAIDGLILSTHVKEWNQRTGGLLTLSSLLERYYSTRGVFDSTYQACKRKDINPMIAYPDTMKEQAVGVAIMLTRSRDAVQIDQDTLKTFANTAVSALNSYVPSGISDTCSTASVDVEPSIDLLVVIDCAWPFEEISAVLQPIREQIKAPWRSKFTVYSGMEFQSLMNSTNMTLNSSDYSNCKPGMDLKNLLEGYVRTYYRDYLEWEKNTTHTNTSATVVLFIPYTFSPTTSEIDSAVQAVRSYRRKLPDVTFLYLIPGTANSLQYLVEDTSKDVFTFTDTKKVDVTQLVQRLREAPRRITNPACGADLVEANYNTIQFQELVNYLGVNYYRIHPKYLFPAGDVTIKIRGDYGGLKVCYSRSSNQPDNATSSGDTQCTSTTGSGAEFTIKLSGPCSGFEDILQCPPLYIAVQSIDQTPSYQCKTDRSCRSVDDVMYTVTHTGLTCGVGCFLANPFTLTLGILLLIIFKSLFGSS